MGAVHGRMIVAVGKEPSDDLSHRHLSWVATDDSEVVAIEDVYRDLMAGGPWWSSYDGVVAAVRPRFYCPQPGCLRSPYIQTDLDGDGPGNLENLPEI